MPTSSSPSVHAGYLDYAEGDTVCEGYVAHDTAREGRLPCVLLAHAWDGQNDFFRAMAERLAGQGYLAFALDVYGKGVRGGMLDDNSHLMRPFMEDRALLRRRLLAALDAARRHPRVDPERIAVLGYCFGGLCALDLARSAPPGLRGAVSVHGVLHPPNLGPQAQMTTRVLILHGWEDPTGKPADVLAVTRELTEAGAGWELQAYGHAMHAFTFAGANAPELGIRYDATADRRSALAMRTFLEEVLGEAAP
ncbi:dienelactone hydrolase family protein [Pyxidicoccus sp. 3LG]